MLTTFEWRCDAVVTLKGEKGLRESVKNSRTPLGLDVRGGEWAQKKSDNIIMGHHGMGSSITIKEAENETYST